MNRPTVPGFAVVVAMLLAVSACSDPAPSRAPDDDGGASTDDGGPTTREDGGRRDGSTGDPDGGTDETDGGGGDGGCQTQCALDDCGEVPNGCGDFLSCASCSRGQVCGQYEQNKCGTPPPVACTPIAPEVACAGKCGFVPNGCSDVIDCADVPGSEVCDANESCTANECVASGPPPCVPDTCASRGHACGQLGDRCGGITADCGACDADERCDYNPEGSRCVELPDDLPTCEPRPQAEACAETCGTVSDGCEGTYTCPCAAGTTCGGGGVPGQCGTGGATCTPLDVTTVCAGKCGSQSNGCGGAYV